VSEALNRAVGEGRIFIHNYFSSLCSSGPSVLSCRPSDWMIAAVLVAVVRSDQDKERGDLSSQEYEKV
jgi:hypothetical protein